VSQADENLPPLPPDEEAAWLGALEAALRPGELSPALNERLIEMALEEPWAEPSPEERLQSERLRRALDEGRDHEDAALLASLRAPFDTQGADAALARALSRALPAASPEATRKSASRVIYAIFGTSGAVAAAAAAWLVFATSTAQEPARSADSTATYARPRTTGTLFSEPFRTADTTARMDRIASVRARDLRDNRYAAWGVR
jgi:hypothetical protein